MIAFSAFDGIAVLYENNFSIFNFPSLSVTNFFLYLLLFISSKSMRVLYVLVDGTNTLFTGAISLKYVLFPLPGRPIPICIVTSVVFEYILTILSISY